MKKYIILGSSILIFNIFFSYWWQKGLEITFCDVGQGDAILISIGSTQMLVDAGPNDKVLQCLENNMPFWDRTIEFFVLTHMDSDHISGAPQVLTSFEVEYLFINPSNKKTSDFDLLEQAVLSKVTLGTRVIHTFVEQQILITDDLRATVIAPEIDFPQVVDNKYMLSETILSDENLNNAFKKLTKNGENCLSIALFISFKDVDMILSGDLEKEGELAIKSNGLLDRVSILKAGHHGSKTSSTPEFIEVLQPEITIISSGKNNVYNHPNPQVIDTLTRFGSKIYQTKASGELHFVSDGYNFWQTRVSEN